MEETKFICFVRWFIFFTLKQEIVFLDHEFELNTFEKCIMLTFILMCVLFIGTFIEYFLFIHVW